MKVLIHGENSYFSYLKLEEFTKDKNLIKLDGEEFVMNEFYDKAVSSSLFNEEVAIVIKNFSKNNKKTEIDEMLEFLKKNPDTNLLLFYEDEAVKKNTKFYKFFKEKAKEFCFPSLRKNDIKNWIKKEFVKDSYVIEEEIPELLTLWLGEDLWQIGNEIEKLKIAGMEEKRISLELMKALSFMKTGANVFDFTDALGYRNKKECLTLFTRSINAGESAHYFFSMAIRQFRLLIQIRELLDKNLRSDAIIKNMGLNPFVARKTIPQADKFTLTELKKIYDKLIQIDEGIKLGDDMESKLESLICEVCV